MICEMCGKETSTGVLISVEGSALKVCPDCRKFGRPLDVGSATTELPRGPLAREIVTQRLQQRRKRMEERDLFSELPEMELEPDWPQRIRKARERLNLSQDQLGQLLREKTSIVQKLENGAMTPPDDLVRKIEKTLKIRLRAVPSSGT
jgi:putative transcription factor